MLTFLLGIGLHYKFNAMKVECSGDQQWYSKWPSFVKGPFEVLDAFYNIGFKYPYSARLVSMVTGIDVAAFSQTVTFAFAGACVTAGVNLIVLMCSDSYALRASKGLPMLNGHLQFSHPGSLYYPWEPTVHYHSKARLDQAIS